MVVSNTSMKAPNITEAAMTRGLMTGGVANPVGFDIEFIFPNLANPGFKSSSHASAEAQRNGCPARSLYALGSIDSALKQSRPV